MYILAASKQPRKEGGAVPEASQLSRPIHVLENYSRLAEAFEYDGWFFKTCRLRESSVW